MADTQHLAKAADEPSSGAAEEASDPNFMTSLARGLSVIRAFTEREPNLTIADIAKITGLPRAAARRCLLTLMQLGYAGSDGRTFHLRPKILALGYSFLSSAPLATILDPLIEQVSGAVQESCSAAVLDEDDVVYIARAATKRIMSVGLNVGSRLPAYCTSMGRVLLAALPESELDAYLARVPLKPYTERTITAADALKRELERVRDRGFSLVDQELELGLRSIAVPIRTATGGVVAAMNISAQAARVTCPEMEVQFLPHLTRAAEEARVLLVRSRGV
ncbi:IclR family transcriptional regulator (plasmid) [Azospirillum oryzae]|uniref:IclR family transcriptional regulator n=1 Tax=Azospirillum oryzae TaxID=286727 RepID=A0A6N1ARG2_9PROT|nr:MULTISPECIES: IclR family transcriptional regulator [Azospirillum]KAA0570736.1 helix-turn-helix domain-containing protein [Azospirillum sp. Sh1]KAA0586956.1 helix-turn-helix domain-containing protein [Azospirillum oryzae]QKS54180.1 IclR family transcriptional regulator [Azospirillum oryzae]GLR80156.1 transcriptional regulator [Azospirillum oryzae]